MNATETSGIGNNPGLTVSTKKQSNKNNDKECSEWSEIRLSGKLPERRSNHCSFIVTDQ
jgi:hypothetical protein